MFEAVGVFALLATQVDEEVCGPGRVLGAHVPRDAEGVAGHLADLDVVGGGEGRLHVCNLLYKRREKEKEKERERMATQWLFRIRNH